METRQLGRTGLQVSALGFGCGAVGGLLVKGEREAMARVIAHAIAEGITYFDTASSYGNGRSETNLGRVLKALNADVIVGTKVQLRGGDFDDIAGACVASVEASLKRLQREYVHLIQLHNTIASTRQPERGWVDVEDASIAVRTFQKLQQQGKVGAWGINGLGETPALHQAVATSQAQTIQCCYNLINPSGGVQVPAGFPYQDYGGLIDKAAAAGMGVIAIRILAGGALTGSTIRHPNAAKTVGPIGTGPTFADDVARAQDFQCLVTEGYAESLVEAAIRFAISKPEIATAMIGISNMEQLKQAVAAANKGPLPAEALTRLHKIWAVY